MCDKTLSVATGIRPWLAGSRRDNRSRVMLGMIALTLILAGGCDTPYTRRVERLHKLYEQGMSREDYMRFVHETERWEGKP